MIDVDGLSRRFGSGMAQHLCIAALLHKIDVSNRLHAYNSTIGNNKNVARLDPTLSHQDEDAPILAAQAIVSTTTHSIPTPLTSITKIPTPKILPVVSFIYSIPILLCHTPLINDKVLSLESDGSDLSATIQVASN